MAQGICKSRGGIEGRRGEKAGAKRNPPSLQKSNGFFGYISGGGVAHKRIAICREGAELLGRGNPEQGARNKDKREKSNLKDSRREKLSTGKKKVMGVGGFCYI